MGAERIEARRDSQGGTSERGSLRHTSSHDERMMQTRRRRRMGRRRRRRMVMMHLGLGMAVTMIAAMAIFPVGCGAVGFNERIKFKPTYYSSLEEYSDADLAELRSRCLVIECLGSSVCGLGYVV
jgi:hypothetical protein